MITNPLRDPRDRRLPRVPEPCALVVFGITGDLARKKLLPAVYDLANRGLLPTNFALLGFARRELASGGGQGVFYLLSSSCCRTESESSFQESTNFCTPSFSSTRKTSSMSMPASRSACMCAAASS